MRITLKLFAMLERYLAPGSQNHAMEVELPEGTTARQLIDRLKIPAPLAHLVLVDGTHLMPEELERRPLRDGDTVSIFPPIAGG